MFLSIYVVKGTSFNGRQPTITLKANLNRLAFFSPSVLKIKSNLS